MVRFLVVGWMVEVPLVTPILVLAVMAEAEEDYGVVRPTKELISVQIVLAVVAAVM